MNQSPIVGCILGTAVGDAIGLPYEGLSRRRGGKVFGPPEGHHLLFRRGMVSDDTEHTCMVAQALIASGGDVEAFCRSLGWRFRFWFLGLPAGIGFATLRAILRLWIGFPPDKSGVFSAGNGPAMRAAILGAALDDRQALRRFVRASSRITHTDPKAEHGALAIAFAAHWARSYADIDATSFAKELRSLLESEGEELMELVDAAAASARNGESTESFADSLRLSKGVSGFVNHSVPVALHAWFTHPRDYRSAVAAVIRCGGDTDTTAAMTGGIVGAAVGKAGIPAEWLHGLIEWPRSISWMEQLGNQLDAALNTDAKGRPLRLPLAGVLARNVLFLIVVLFHGFRRLLPPY
jgi:ADP-ribosylglycohydrolase